ncbi:hypothetical protein [Microbispora rosea]|uniref:hypothetical protein n=1 Tax=Microbispora rosea TaxID=58117 RepID=UPI0004C41081|nr:hypothetical protein [Microbispora rosea]
MNPRREFFYATPAEVRDLLEKIAGQHLLEYRGGRTRRRDEANWPLKLAPGAIVAVATLAGCHQHVTGEPCGDGSYAYGIICSPWA